MTRADRAPDTAPDALRPRPQDAERYGIVADAIDSMDDHDNSDEDWIPPHERDPSEFADPSCVECGGQGGWCGSFTADGQCIWVECDCVEYPDG